MTSPHFPNCFYRVTIKGLYVRDGKLLLLREPTPDSDGGYWELPGGGLDFGEDIRACLEREIEEEMRLNVLSVDQRPTYVWTTRFEDKRNLDWFYSLLLAYRIDFEHLEFTPTNECAAIGFFTREELATLPLKRQARGLITHFDPADIEPGSVPLPELT